MGGVKQADAARAPPTVSSRHFPSGFPAATFRPGWKSCSKRPLVLRHLASENHWMGVSELVLILLLVTWAILLYAVIRLLFAVVWYLRRRR